MKKSTQILLGGFIVLLVAAYFLTRESDRVATYEMADKLFTIDSAAIDKVELVKGAQKIVLEKSGIEWMITSPIYYRANQTEAGDLIKTARDMKLESLVSSNPQKQSLFSVDSTGTQVLLYQQGNQKAAFVVGKTGGNFMTTYVRKADANEVYLAQGMLGVMFDKQVRDWRDKTIFKTTESSIMQVKFIYQDSMFVLQNVDSAWRVGSDLVQPMVVQNLISALGNLQADDFVDSAITKPPKPHLILDVTCANRAQLIVYPQDTTTQKYRLRASTSNQVFELFKYSADRLLKRRWEVVKK
jgi:hypothetical protein